MGEESATMLTEDVRYPIENYLTHELHATRSEENYPTFAKVSSVSRAVFEMPVRIFATSSVKVSRTEDTLSFFTLVARRMYSVPFYM